MPKQFLVTLHAVPACQAVCENVAQQAPIYDISANVHNIYIYIHIHTSSLSLHIRKHGSQIYIYIYIYIYICVVWHGQSSIIAATSNHTHNTSNHSNRKTIIRSNQKCNNEEGDDTVGTLIELNLLNSSCSSLSSC